MNSSSKIMIIYIVGVCVCVWLMNDDDDDDENGDERPLSQYTNRSSIMRPKEEQ